MAGAAEEMVKVLDETTDEFELVNDMQVFKDGIADLVRRLQALEAAQKKQEAK